MTETEVIIHSVMMLNAGMERLVECNITIPKPRIEFKSKGRAAGIAWKGRIVIDTFIGGQDIAELKNTVLHELAHVVVMHLFPSASSHGREWQRVMGLLGEKPRRCHYLKSKPAREKIYHVAVCDCAGRERFISTRNKNSYRYTCASCGAPVRYTGETVR